MGQQIVIREDWERFDWKRRLAAKIIGETHARSLARPVTQAQAWLRYTATPSGRANRSFLRQFENAHLGDRCVIIGNGPSLRNTDMTLLHDEYTFGLNRIYLMFEELGFATTYHVAINQLVVEQYAEDLCAVDAPLFTMVRNRPFLSGKSNIGYLSGIIGPWFSRDASRGIWEGHTVTYVAMQLAYYMGFSKVILVGVDHRFAVDGKPNQLVESAGPDASHFDPRYFAKGTKWQLPDLENSEVSYRLARDAFEADGRQILDATVGGALTVFPKVSLEEALQS